MVEVKASSFKKIIKKNIRRISTESCIKNNKIQEKNLHRYGHLFSKK